jgi:hypothetical protein
MNVARSVADVLAEHVTFEVECIDRMYCNVYVPQLQYAAGLVGFVQRQLGLPIASTAPLAAITDRFSRRVHAFARVNNLTWVDFAKGQRKDDVMAEHLASFSAAEGVVFVGRAQEKTPLFRTEKRRTADGRSYPVDREDDRGGEPLLLLLPRRRLRPVLPQGLLLLPL